MNGAHIFTENNGRILRQLKNGKRITKNQCASGLFMCHTMVNESSCLKNNPLGKWAVCHSEIHHHVFILWYFHHVPFKLPLRRGFECPQGIWVFVYQHCFVFCKIRTFSKIIVQLLISPGNFGMPKALTQPSISNGTQSWNFPHVSIKYDKLFS